MLISKYQEMYVATLESKVETYWIFGNLLATILAFQ